MIQINSPSSANTQIFEMQANQNNHQINGFQQSSVSSNQNCFQANMQIGATDHVNQLKQLHQRLLLQHFHNQQQKVNNVQAQSYVSNSPTPPSFQSSFVNNIAPVITSAAAASTQLRSVPQNQQVCESNQINIKLLQLKQQLELSKANSNPSSTPSNGPSELQMKLRQHILTQQANKQKSANSLKTSPKSKREQKKGYTSGSDSSIASQSQKSSSTTLGKRSYQETSAASSEQKFQMYDHSTEQKKRRLQMASYHQNEIFHTSGNRLIPMMPKNILGGAMMQQPSK